MNPFARMFRLTRDLLQELSDEAVYRRYLRAVGRPHSPQEWRRFTDRRYRRKYQSAKCC